MTVVAFRIDSLMELTDEVFLKLCQANPEVKFESTASGELIVVPPTGGETGNRNLRLTQQLGIWSDANGTGLAFDSSTLFILPNQARRSPDAAWILLERWDVLTPEERETATNLTRDTLQRQGSSHC